MATGLEVLGAVSAVCALASFARETISVCKRVYNGESTADEDLKKHAEQMSEAIAWVQTRCMGIGSEPSDYNSKFEDIVKGCRTAAAELETELGLVTSMNQKRNGARVIQTFLNGPRHRRKIERLEASLSRYRHVLETEMLLHLCSRSDAIQIQHRQSFADVEKDIQTLVTQVAKRKTKLEDIIKTVVISHFFWKIGSPPQHTFKGLLCSLVYKSIAVKQQLIQQILYKFPDLLLKTSYSDWSIVDLECIFEFILLEDEEPCCYFIDGLDEVCGKDDPFKVRQFIGKILNFPKIKICVSTRQETIITDWVRKLNIPQLLLEDLTKPDIQAFVHKELNPFFANGALKKETFLLLKITLVFKAQGVFLWIYLAIESIKSGIHHQDSEDILLSRLEEFPDEVETLYADMWRRMNKNSSIYAQKAARYLSYVLEEDWYVPMITGVGPATLDPEISQPTLFQVACAENFKAHEILLGNSVTTSGVELHALHKEAPLDVQNRCATVAIVNGVNSDLSNDVADVSDVLFGRVEFIHRTAHDFLSELMELLQIMQNLYEGYGPSWECQAPFISFLTSYANLEYFVKRSIAQEKPSLLATRVLRDAWSPDRHSSLSPTSRLIDALISMKADPHSYGANQRFNPWLESMKPFVREGTAFTNLFMFAFHAVIEGGYPGSEPSREILKVAMKMATTCPDFSSTTLLLVSIREGYSQLMDSWKIPILIARHDPSSFWLLYEVDLRFLLSKVVSGLRNKLTEDTLGDVLWNQLLERLEGSSAKIRFVICTKKDLDEKAKTHNKKCNGSILSRRGFEIRQVRPQFATPSEITEHIFRPSVNITRKEIREIFQEGARLTREFATKLVSCHDMEKFDLESAIASVSGKGLRVICPLCHWTSEDIFPRALDT
ncbi:hypothetical protein QSH57_002965 [Fusarium oxysporum f. sp. vasinfectum]|nr:hypothetical protein QSH57_002965 [Fusarium oxysporum f. sp. vasinfectum]